MEVTAPSLAVLKEYYKGASKKPKLYGYSSTGDLTFLAKDGSITQTVPLPYYRAPTHEETKEMNTARYEALKTAQENFEKARQALRAAIEEKSATPSEIIALNRRVFEMDVTLQEIHYPLKQFLIGLNTQVNKVLFDERYNETAIEVGIFKSRQFTLQDEYVRIDTTRGGPVVETVAVPEKSKKTKKPSRPVILFSLPDKNEYGFLSNEWPVTIDYNTVSYPSAKHALFAELAKEFGDIASYVDIQKIPDAIDIVYTVENFPSATEETWNSKRSALIQNITREKFAQHPELIEKLIQTGEARLGADVATDNLFGIGMSIDNPAAMKSKSWTGQNLLGKTLMRLRDRFKEERQQAEAALVPGPAPGPAPGPLGNILGSIMKTASAVIGTEAQSQPVKRKLKLVKKAVTEPIPEEP